MRYSARCCYRARRSPWSSFADTVTKFSRDNAPATRTLLMPLTSDMVDALEGKPLDKDILREAMAHLRRGGPPT